MVTARQRCSRAGNALRWGVATFVLVLTGCGGGGGDRSDAKPPAETEALEAYGLMWTEQITAYRAASADGTDLRRYTSPDVWAAFEADLARMQRERTAMRGDLRHEPEATVLAGAQPPTVTVKDCVDGSDWQTLDTTTGWRIPSPPGRPVRYAATAKLERANGGRWTVTEYTPHRTSPCQGLSAN